MSTVLDPDALLGAGDVDDDDNFHHHARMTQSEYFYARDNDLPLRALCGVLRQPLPQPYALPCCPRCEKLMNKPCTGGM